MGSIGVGTREPARPGSATMVRAAVSTDPTTNLEGRTRRRPYARSAAIARLPRRPPHAKPRIVARPHRESSRGPTENRRAGRSRPRRRRAPERAHSKVRERGAQAPTRASGVRRDAGLFARLVDHDDAFDWAALYQSDRFVAPGDDLDAAALATLAR